MADAGRPGARTALALAEDPGRFLSTVQIGITLIGILAGAFSGAALGERMGQTLLDAGVPAGVASPLGYGIVIGIITYLSVVIGELVPKQFALRNPEAIACVIAPPMLLLSKIGKPFVWLLDASSRLVFRLFGLQSASDSVVTEEEIRTIVAEAEAAGVIEGDEKQMIAGVLRLGDRPVRGLMTPRTDVDWIDLAADPEIVREKVLASTHSRLPVAEGGPDNMLGVVHVRELLAASMAGKSFDPRAYIKPAPIIPDMLDALDVLDTLRRADVPMALVHDEYGHFEGVVTPADVLEAIAGVFRADTGAHEPDLVEREDGSWLIAGYMAADEMADRLNVPLPSERDYQTVAGLVLTELQEMPVTGSVVEAYGWRFEVVDMDGRRIDKVLASRVR